jgi:hypothetical protein
VRSGITEDFHTNLSSQTVKLFSVTFVPSTTFFGTRLRAAQQAKKAKTSQALSLLIKQISRTVLAGFQPILAQSQKPIP